LPPEEADPERLLKTQEDALAEIGAREVDLQEKETRQRIEIERAQAEGRYERLSELEERLSAKQEELRAMQVSAQAVKLLGAIINQRRESMVSGRLPKLEAAISRMLKAITDRERPVQMASGFTVEEVADDADGNLHQVGDLSAGAQEQLDLVARLALGEAYAAEYGRTMMVLDDVLLYTDPERHDRVKEILKRAAASLQIFILTSHEDRYRGIVETEYQFDLEALRQAAT